MEQEKEGPNERPPVGLNSTSVLQGPLNRTAYPAPNGLPWPRIYREKEWGLGKQSEPIAGMGDGMFFI